MPTIAAFVPVQTALRPYFYGDFATPAGHVFRKATPVNTPEWVLVRLHSQSTGALIAESFSERGSGGYQFQRIKAGTYYAVAFDHTNLNNGEIVTDIVAVPMTT